MNKTTVLSKLLALISERTEAGLATYNEPLTTHNGRRALRDAIQESYDLTMYLLQAEQELCDLATLLERNFDALPDNVRNEVKGFVETWGDKKAPQIE